jgi:phosphatidylethanolamine-binding protein (PEBP) family uncharacterized protein
MELATSAFADDGIIRPEFAFGAMDAVTHVKLSANRNPDFRWSGVPAGTRSLALLCHDPDVPSRGDDVNKEGRIVPASLPRVDFFHWVLVDLPPDARPIERGEFSEGVTARGKPGPHAPRGARQGINDYTGWFAGDADMAGNYFGYDGPCTPGCLSLSLCLHMYARCRTAATGIFTAGCARPCRAHSRSP